jgi:hypothetical protein
LEEMGANENVEVHSTKSTQNYTKRWESKGEIGQQYDEEKNEVYSSDM